MFVLLELTGWFFVDVTVDRFLHTSDILLGMAGWGADATLVGDDIGTDALTLL